MKKTTVPPFPESGLVRPAQVMQYLNVPKSTFYRWRKEGRLPEPKQWGGTSVWNAETIRQFVKNLHGPCADSRTVVTQ